MNPVAQHYLDCRRQFMWFAREARLNCDANGVDYWLSQARWFHRDMLRVLRGEPESQW